MIQLRCRSRPTITAKARFSRADNRRNLARFGIDPTHIMIAEIDHIEITLLIPGHFIGHAQGCPLSRATIAVKPTLAVSGVGFDVSSRTHSSDPRVVHVAKIKIPIRPSTNAIDVVQFRFSRRPTIARKPFAPRARQSRNRISKHALNQKSKSYKSNETIFHEKGLREKIAELFIE